MTPGEPAARCRAPLSLRPLAPALVAGLLAACGGGGGGNGAPAADAPIGSVGGAGASPLPGSAILCPLSSGSLGSATATAPTIELTFPFPHAGYDRETIGVSGRVSHAEPERIGVTACIGNWGVERSATPDGRFSLGGLPVSGSGQTFTIVLEARHSSGASTRQSLTLARTPVSTYVPSLILDRARNRLVGVDTYSGAVYGVRLGDSSRELIAASPLGTGVAPRLVNPTAITHDVQADVFYVVDDALDALIGVDPDNGAVTIVSAAIRGAGPALLTPTDVGFDAARNRVLVADVGRGAIVAIDPGSGDRSIVSSRDVGTGPVIGTFTAMGLDTRRDRAVVLASSTNEIYAVNLASGDRVLLSDSSNDAPDVPRYFTGIDVVASAGVAFLTDDFSNAVVRLDLTTGARQSISSSGLVTASPLIAHPVIGQGPRLEAPSDAVLDAVANRLFITDHEFAQPLIEVDQASGDRRLIVDSRVGAGVNFRDLIGLDLDAQRGLVYVADPTADVVAAIDLASGDRTSIEAPASGRGTIDTAPRAVAVDHVAGVAYIVDFTTDALYSVDLASGARAPVSDAGHGLGPAFEAPIDIELDPAAGRAYVLDLGLDALLAVELATGNRSSLGPGVAGIALDVARERLFLADARAHEITVLDLASGVRSPVSSSSVGSGPSFIDIVDLAIDAANDRLIVIDESRQALVAVDLATGEREIISGESSSFVVVGPEVPPGFAIGSGGGPPLARPQRIAVDAERQVAFVTDSLYDALFAIDLGSGYRQIIAK